MLYTVTVFDKKDKKFNTYRHVQSINYGDDLSRHGEITTVSGDEMLTHRFDLRYDMHLVFADQRNVVISSTLIVSLDITQE